MLFSLVIFLISQLPMLISPKYICQNCYTWMLKMLLLWAGASNGKYVWLCHTRLEAAEHWCAEWTLRPTALRTHWLPLWHLRSLPPLGVSWHQLANSWNAHKVTHTCISLPQHLLWLLSHIHINTMYYGLGTVLNNNNAVS